MKTIVVALSLVLATVAAGVAIGTAIASGPEARNADARFISETLNATQGVV